MAQKLPESILPYFSLQQINDEDLSVVYGGTVSKSLNDRLHAWLGLLPDIINDTLKAALRQERPFLPPEITPELMSAENSKIPTMNQMELLYRCVDLAYRAGEFKMAASLAFVVDRASYWSGMSKGVLQVIDLIKEACPEAAIAPQVQVRRARVLKDDGDLHGAMRVLDKVLERPQGLPGEWQYKDDDQYLNTKAEIIKIKGNILHNLGLFQEAVGLLLESIHLFDSLQEKDEKGIASSLGLLTKCLGNLSLKAYDAVREQFPDKFVTDHPCYESYIQGHKAIGYIKGLNENLYRLKDMVDADVSLLKYAVLHTYRYELIGKIIRELKSTLGAHKSVNALRSSEQFYEFVRALFMISLTLVFCPVAQDRQCSHFLHHLSIQLYKHLCLYNMAGKATRLEHTQESVRNMNLSLGVLGLEGLEGLEGLPDEKTVSKETEVHAESKEGVTVSEQTAEMDVTSGVTHGDPSEVASKEKHENPSIESSKENQYRMIMGSKSCTEGDGSQTSVDLDNPEAREPDVGCGRIPAAKGSPSKRLKRDSDTHSDTQDLRAHSELKIGPSNPLKKPVSGTHTTSLNKNEFHIKKEISNCKTYTYGFRNQTKSTDNKTVSYTFPLANGAQVDPEKPWKVYKLKCVGLPVDPDFFSSLTPCDENGLASPPVDDEEDPPLVNLSVPDIKATVESREKNSKTTESLVDLSASTVYSSSSKASGNFYLHPHDLPNQPMRRQIDIDKHHLEEEVQMSELPPLVDLSASTLSSLGNDTSMSDPAEFINNWQPPDTKSQVNPAFLLTYNPADVCWSAQSTLVYIGEKLELEEKNTGNCRDVFYIQFLHQEEPRGRYVGKKYRKDVKASRYMQDVVCQMMAGYYVNKFNEGLRNYKHDIQVQVLPAANLQLLDHKDRVFDFINVEPYLHGDFIKLTNNLAFSNKKEHKGEELATALTHFSYCESQGVHMMVDIQGWLPRDGKGVIYLTDPQFHTSGGTRFSPYDHQEKGMMEFWETVHPHCNEMCRALGLMRPE